jgi:glucose-1-phosphate adenylyltransferase
VAALPVPLDAASGFGIIDADADGRIVGWEEKPPHPRPTLSDPTRALSSMGNYIFTTEVLEDVLVEDARRSTDHDFGRTIIPELYPYSRAYAYDFLTNEIPDLKATEERGYWRDVGTIDAYWRANMDLLGQTPALDLDNPRWPILAPPFAGPSARIVAGEVEDSLLGEGTIIRGGSVRRSILGQGVLVEPGAAIEDSIVMDNTTVGAGARIRRTIVDRFNTVEPGAVLGWEPSQDLAAGILDPSGIVVIGRGATRVRGSQPVHP